MTLYHPKDLLSSLGIYGNQRFGSHKKFSKKATISYLHRKVDNDYDWESLYEGFIKGSLPEVEVSESGHLYDGCHRCWLHFILGSYIKGKITLG